MTNSWPIRVAALCGGLAVALGAFGAHGLHTLLSQNERVDTYQTAVLYHFLHALMLFLLATRVPFHKGPFLCLLAGIIIFSGSLYVLALTNLRWLGAITPLGGVAFLIGWFWLVIAPKTNS